MRRQRGTGAAHLVLLIALSLQRSTSLASQEQQIQIEPNGNQIIKARDAPLGRRMMSLSRPGFVDKIERKLIRHTHDSSSDDERYYGPGKGDSSPKSSGKGKGKGKGKGDYYPYHDYYESSDSSDDVVEEGKQWRPLKELLRDGTCKKGKNTRMQCLRFCIEK